MIHIDEIEARLREQVERDDMAFNIHPAPTVREARYLVAGAFAAFVVGVLIAGAVL